MTRSEKLIKAASLSESLINDFIDRFKTEVLGHDATGPKRDFVFNLKKICSNYQIWNWLEQDGHLYDAHKHFLDGFAVTTQIGPDKDNDFLWDSSAVASPSGIHVSGTGGPGASHGSATIEFTPDGKFRKIVNDKLKDLTIDPSKTKLIQIICDNCSAQLYALFMDFFK